jgi:hypothetical protein
VVAQVVQLIIRVPICIIEVGLPHGPLEPLPHARERILVILNDVKLTCGTLVNIVAALDLN